MNKYKKLLNNSFIFAVGNLGTKVIAILIVPLYTYYLSPSEYGVTDLITTTTNLLIPVVSLSIFDAVLRFVMDNDADKESILTSGVIVSLGGLVVSFFFYPIIAKIMGNNELIVYLYILLLLQIFYSLFSQFVRGIGKVKIFASSGIIVAMFLLFFNLFFIVYLKMGIVGYILSLIISTVIGIMYLLVSVNLFQHLKWDKVDKNLIKKMLIYSVPLIPNSLMWWITNASGRFFILYYLGLSANGLYAVANKFPSLLSIFYSIFFQAWQLSAIEEFNSKENSTFYSNIFNFFSVVMFTGAALFMIVLKPMLLFTVESTYFVTWRYIPFLLLGVIFSSFSSFVTANYIAAKKTKGIFTTSIFGAVVNLIGNFFFVPLWGVMGASVSLMVSFFFTWIIRMRGSKKLVSLKLDKFNIIFNLIFLFLQIAVLNLNIGLIYETFSNICIFILICLNNKKYIVFLIRKILSKDRK